MNLKKQECLQQSINRKDSGQIEYVCGLFMVLIMAVVMYTCLQLELWKSASLYIEDALASSNLASALIDLEEYGKTHRVLIRDEKHAFEVYRQAIKENLELDEKWECANKQLFAGPIEIADYMIFNVDGTNVEMVYMDSTGNVEERRNGVLGKVKAPDGTVIECTGIYSELKFAVKGFGGLTIEAEKGVLADIVPRKGEEDEKG